MLLTIRSRGTAVVDVYCDSEGLEYLIRVLERLRKGGHDHLMTPSWSGDELTEEGRDPEAEIVHQLNVTLVAKT